MKQYITIEQWCDASDEVQAGWNKWCKQHKDHRRVFFDKLGVHNLPYIGQMIEFLGLDYWKSITYFPPEGEIYMMSEINAGVQPELICDALWQAVKEILER